MRGRAARGFRGGGHGACGNADHAASVHCAHRGGHTGQAVSMANGCVRACVGARACLVVRPGLPARPLAVSRSAAAPPPLPLCRCCLLHTTVLKKPISSLGACSERGALAHVLRCPRCPPYARLQRRPRPAPLAPTPLPLTHARRWSVPGCGGPSRGIAALARVETVATRATPSRPAPACRAEAAAAAAGSRAVSAALPSSRRPASGPAGGSGPAEHTANNPLASARDGRWGTALAPAPLSTGRSASQ